MIERGDMIPLEVRQGLNASAAVLLLNRQALPPSFYWHQLIENRSPELVEVFGSRLEEVLSKVL